MQCSGCIGEYTGLGQLDPVTVAAMFTEAKALWEQLSAALGIGAGRREADVITPLQNKVTQTVLVPVFTYLDQITNQGATPDCSQLRSYQTELASGERQWLNYLHTTKWIDGRAATQAEATLAPYFASAKTKLTQAITDHCGGIGNNPIGDVIGNILKTPSGETNWPVILGAVGIGFMLLRRK